MTVDGQFLVAVFGLLVTLIGMLGGALYWLGRRFAEIDRRFEEINRRFAEVDRRFEALERRFDELERRLEAKLTAFADSIRTGVVVVNPLVIEFLGIRGVLSREEAEFLAREAGRILSMVRANP